MKVDGGAHNPRKSAMRHAADLAYFLAAAGRSAAAIEREAIGRSGGRALQIKEITMRLRRQALDLEKELVR